MHFHPAGIALGTEVIDHWGERFTQAVQVLLVIRLCESHDSSNSI